MKSRNFKVNNKRTMFRIFLDFFANLFFTYCFIAGVALILFSSVTIECEVIGSSMLPNFNNYPNSSHAHDVVYVNTCDKNFSYSDIVVCNTGDDAIIKRVIGITGDTIDIVWDEYEYKLELNGKIIEEDYIKLSIDPRDPVISRNGMDRTYEKFQDLKVSKPELFNEFGQLVVPVNSVFVLGDNRHVSVDSSTLGTFNMDQISGKVELVKYHGTTDVAFYWSYIVEGKFITTLINIF